MKVTLLMLILVMAFTGGLLSFWDRVSERISLTFGCMRYTYDVSIWREYESELVVHRLVSHAPMSDAVHIDILRYIHRQYSEYEPCVVMSWQLVSKRSVMLSTFGHWLYRAFTRTADDAVREWKEQTGQAV
ncbi:MAG: hypothetical protein AB7E51_18700 [Pseudodesulfovibrio sp.]|uniref:hypothetical protein n=1 Tax=Pseudodesulfovibrio sp. TaxID=2035812 RepID=UPI003D0EB650